jgi:hypothetical protein
VLAPALAALASAVVLAGPAGVDGAPPPVPERLPTGLYLRAEVAFGAVGSGAWTSPEAPDSVASFWGPILMFGVSLGGTVSEDFVIAAEFWGSALLAPEFSPSTATGGGGALLAFGPQFTWYWMPANIYLSITPAVSFLSLTVNGTTTHAQPGFGFKAAFGWEIRVARDLALGPAIQAQFSMNRNAAGVDLEWDTFGMGIGLSVTWN